MTKTLSYPKKLISLNVLKICKEEKANGRDFYGRRDVDGRRERNRLRNCTYSPFVYCFMHLNIVSDIIINKRECIDLYAYTK